MPSITINDSQGLLISSDGSGVSINNNVTFSGDVNGLQNIPLATYIDTAGTINLDCTTKTNFYFSDPIEGNLLFNFINLNLQLDETVVIKTWLSTDGNPYSLELKIDGSAFDATYFYNSSTGLSEIPIDGVMQLEFSILKMSTGTIVYIKSNTLNNVI